MIIFFYIGPTKSSAFVLLRTIPVSPFWLDSTHFEVWPKFEVTLYEKVVAVCEIASYAFCKEDDDDVKDRYCNGNNGLLGFDFTLGLIIYQKLGLEDWFKQ